jgi:hypothetical protein
MTVIDVQGKVSGQVAGNIFNNHLCADPDHCPFERDEARAQRRFEKHTGIACSRGARIALQHLLDTGAFDYKQLEIAWRMRSLKWDWKDLKLKTNVSLFEIIYGWFMLTVSLGSLSLGLLVFVLGGDKNPSLEQTQSLVTIAVFISIVPFAEKYIIRPNRIAKRAIPFLEGYYAEKKRQRREG